jgi:hypothetical protein
LTFRLRSTRFDGGGRDRLKQPDSRSWFIASAVRRRLPERGLSFAPDALSRVLGTGEGEEASRQPDRNSTGFCGSTASRQRQRTRLAPFTLGGFSVYRGNQEEHAHDNPEELGGAQMLKNLKRRFHYQERSRVRLCKHHSRLMEKPESSEGKTLM